MLRKENKTVTIHRTVGFTHEANKELQEWFGQASRHIGSYFKKGTKKPGSGLSFDEEKLLMPRVLNMPAEDRDFRKQVDLYFLEITTKVPAIDGLTVNISLEDSEKELSEDNLPVDIEDYIKYRHAISHPQVAKNKEQADGNQLFLFYIVDPENTQENLIKKNTEQDKALAVYLANKDHKDKIEMILTNLGIDTRRVENPIIKFKELSQTSPKRFVEISEDKNLKIRWKINRMIQSGTLTKVGERILNGETKDEIGSSIEEAILWFNDKTKTEEVNILFARHKEFHKNKINKEENN